jgi:hypothetical protein
LFETLKGFDESYRNGFEDIDLCLRARRTGAKIVYQPKSVVVHLEEQSPGRKDFDAENLRRFLETWPHDSFPDETSLLLEDGFIVRSKRGDSSCRVIEPVSDPTDRDRWEKVAKVERLVADRDLSILTAVELEPEEWPDDPEALRWGAKLCRLLDRSGIASRFEHRIAALDHTGQRSARLPERNGNEWLARGIRAFLQEI